MQIIRLVPINNPGGAIIDLGAAFPLMPSNLPDPYVVKQIKYLERNGYEIIGTKGNVTAPLMTLAKVPAGQHVEVWGA